MVVHEIDFADIYGRVALPEFLRLAGLVAAGAADVDDLAVEFAREEVTLLLSPDEFRCTTSYDWYMASHGAYQQWMAADDVGNEQDRVMYRGRAVDSYRELIGDAAREMAARAESAAVEVVTVPVVRRLHVVH